VHSLPRGHEVLFHGVDLQPVPSNRLPIAISARRTMPAGRCC
jgi:hypothetical protein